MAGTSLAFIQNVGPWGLIVILILALLIFGKRLPDVAKSLGKGIVEFKKGVRGIEDEVENSVSAPPPSRDDTEKSKESTHSASDN